jgi:hypothetical protein
VTFDFAVLAHGEGRMDDLLVKARNVSRGLRAAGVPHAVIGGLAVRAYLATADEAPALTTRDMDVVLRRADVERAADVFKALGFERRDLFGLPAFIPPGGKLRDGVHVILAGELVKSDALHACPEFDEQRLFNAADGFACIDIRNLVVLKLTSFRPKDVAHLQDLIEFGIVPSDIAGRLPDDLRPRLEQVIEENRREGRETPGWN